MNVLLTPNRGMNQQHNNRQGSLNLPIRVSGRITLTSLLLGSWKDEFSYSFPYQASLFYLTQLLLRPFLPRPLPNLTLGGINLRADMELASSVTWSSFRNKSSSQLSLRLGSSLTAVVDIFSSPESGEIGLGLKLASPCSLFCWPLPTSQLAPACTKELRLLLRCSIFIFPAVDKLCLRCPGLKRNIELRLSIPSLTMWKS